jgi:hypothetical protein
MDEEDHCMTLLCSFPDSWDNLVMAIGSTVKTLVLDEVMVALLSEEVRKNILNPPMRPWLFMED